MDDAREAGKEEEEEEEEEAHCRGTVGGRRGSIWEECCPRGTEGGVDDGGREES